ncbi:unnamed protein product [Prorocentrum cordatum]|uniref:Uncharacterized protein n=1 Tax=Prorocentrum cordatum TaxID=2364126 RepID=A0ABN9RZD0_9DINO|nr:unnamed protein product [Polarella glacialis]
MRRVREGARCQTQEGTATADAQQTTRSGTATATTSPRRQKRDAGAAEARALLKPRGVPPSERAQVVDHDVDESCASLSQKKADPPAAGHGPPPPRLDRRAPLLAGQLARTWPGSAVPTTHDIEATTYVFSDACEQESGEWWNALGDRRSSLEDQTTAQA